MKFTVQIQKTVSRGAKIRAVKTYNDIYLDARKRLKAAGVEAYSLESRLIIAGTAKKTQDQFFRDINLYAGDDFAKAVENKIERRLNGEPVAYITGEWEFYGVPITVTPDVLIPRVDTEVLAEKAIELLKGRQGAATRVLDLCTGSGCLGIAIAANVPFCKVVLADTSYKAINVSRQNIIRNRLTRSVISVEADALKTPPMLLGRFDMIVCNPPYIKTDELPTLDTSVRDYEPILALDGGEDGLVFYKYISQKWKEILKPNGCLMFECGIGQADDVKKIMSKNGFTNIHSFKDTLNIDRVVAGILE